MSPAGTVFHNGGAMCKTHVWHISNFTQCVCVQYEFFKCVSCAQQKMKHIIPNHIYIYIANKVPWSHSSLSSELIPRHYRRGYPHTSHGTPSAEAQRRLWNLPWAWLAWWIRTDTTTWSKQVTWALAATGELNAMHAVYIHMFTCVTPKLHSYIELRTLWLTHVHIYMYIYLYKFIHV